MSTLAAIIISLEFSCMMVVLLLVGILMVVAVPSWGRRVVTSLNLLTLVIARLSTVLLFRCLATLLVKTALNY